MTYMSGLQFLREGGGRGARGEERNRSDLAGKSARNKLRLQGRERCGRERERASERERERERDRESEREREREHSRERRASLAPRIDASKFPVFRGRRESSGWGGEGGILLKRDKDGWGWRMGLGHVRWGRLLAIILEG